MKFPRYRKWDWVQNWHYSRNSYNLNLS